MNAAPRLRALVTGGNGFVGRAAVERAAAAGIAVRAAARQPASLAPRPTVEPVAAPNLEGSADWSHALRGVDAVVHCAARVHVMRETSSDPLAAFRRVNVEGTLELARQAVAAGVRRFVFLSSIHVNGGETFGQAFTAGDAPAPCSPYAVSKLEAETALARLADDAGIELVVIRAPLVYGPGVAGNFAALMRVLSRGVPLPLGSVQNRRSLVGVRNLADLIATCLDHPAAAGRTFLVSDGEDLSTPALLRRTAAALGKPARLLPMPPAALRAAARLLGKHEAMQRLCGSLQVDIGATRERLGWTPPIALDVELARTTRHFLAERAAA